MKQLIAPSLLSADFTRLADEVTMLNSSEADWIHLDIMDGVFVPNISFGIPVVKAVKSITTKPLDVHLMIVQPERYIDVFYRAGADIITFHYEASTHIDRTVNAIKSLGIKAGVVLNPHSPISLLEEIITELDLVLLMSVNPGFGGQKFINYTYSKIAKLKNLIEQKKSKALIEIDGGVDETNAAKLVSEGADILVAGNYIFSAKNPQETIALLKK